MSNRTYWGIPKKVKSCGGCISWVAYRVQSHQQSTCNLKAHLRDWGKLLCFLGGWTATRVTETILSEQKGCAGKAEKRLKASQTGGLNHGALEGGLEESQRTDKGRGLPTQGQGEHSSNEGLPREKGELSGENTSHSPRTELVGLGN